jgi:hypothetical protein
VARQVRAEHAAGAGPDRGPAGPLVERVMTDWSAGLPPAQRRVMERAGELVADLFPPPGP